MGALAGTVEDPFQFKLFILSEDFFLGHGKCPYCQSEEMPLYAGEIEEDFCTVDIMVCSNCFEGYLVMAHPDFRPHYAALNWRIDELKVLE